MAPYWKSLMWHPACELISVSRLLTCLSLSFVSFERTYRTWNSYSSIKTAYAIGQPGKRAVTMETGTSLRYVRLGSLTDQRIPEEVCSGRCYLYKPGSTPVPLPLVTDQPTAYGGAYRIRCARLENRRAIQNNCVVQGNEFWLQA